MNKLKMILRTKLILFLYGLAMQLNSKPTEKPTCVYPTGFATFTTQNTYEAAYYLSEGATLSEAKVRKVRENKITKLGYRNQWVMTLTGVPRKAIETWKNGTAQVNARTFEYKRVKLKKKVYKLTHTQ